MKRFHVEHDTFTTLLTFDEDKETVIQVMYQKENEKKVHEVLTKIFKPYSVQGSVSTRFCPYIYADLKQTKLFDDIQLLKLEGSEFITTEVVQ